MIRDFGAIALCILTAYLVAIAASVDGVFFSGIPIILLCAIVSFCDALDDCGSFVNYKLRKIF